MSEAGISFRRRVAMAMGQELVELVRETDPDRRLCAYVDAIALCAEQERYAEVIALAAAAGADGVDHAFISMFLARAYACTGQLRCANGLAGEVLRRHPVDPGLILMQADTLWRTGQCQLAIGMATRAIAVAPTLRAAYERLAWMLNEVYEHEEACRVIERSFRVPGARVDAVPALAIKGTVLLATGQIERSLAAFDEARRLAPEHAGIVSSSLMTRLYDDAISLDELSALHAEAGRRLSEQWKDARFSSWANRRDPERPIRVGIVSGDLSRHPVGLILASLLPHLNPNEASVTLYNTGRRSDDVTPKLREMASASRDLTNLDACDAAELVRADGIDLLVDLSGHTLHNRLDLFALRCAPVQLSWAGYPHTTGLPQIDAMVQDEFTAPLDQDQYYSERLIRLPGCVYTYVPLDDPPPVAPAPVLRNGHITFGCFNQLSKLSDSTLRLWAGAMRAVPDSRLVLKSGPLQDRATRARLLARLQLNGIAPERCTLLGPSPFHEYLEQYSMVDIALDPVPFNGGATTLQGVWQGIPVLTMPGRHHVSRVGGSIMHALGLDDWIADTPEHFATLAKRHAADALALNFLREGMRDRLKRSSVGNPALFAAEMLAAWRMLWRQWCNA